MYKQMKINIYAENDAIADTDGEVYIIDGKVDIILYRHDLKELYYNLIEYFSSHLQN